MRRFREGAEWIREMAGGGKGVRREEGEGWRSGVGEWGRVGRGVREMGKGGG